MRYLNGRLHLAQDCTQLMKPYQPEPRMSCMEYIPLVLLCVLLAGLVLAHLFG